MTKAIIVTVQELVDDADGENVLLVVDEEHVPEGDKLSGNVVEVTPGLSFLVITDGQSGLGGEYPISVQELEGDWSETDVQLVISKEAVSSPPGTRLPGLAYGTSLVVVLDAISDPAPTPEPVPEPGPPDPIGGKPATGGTPIGGGKGVTFVATDDDTEDEDVPEPDEKG